MSPGSINGGLPVISVQTGLPLPGAEDYSLMISAHLDTVFCFNSLDCNKTIQLWGKLSPFLSAGMQFFNFVLPLSLFFLGIFILIMVFITEKYCYIWSDKLQFHGRIFLLHAARQNQVCSKRLSTFLNKGQRRKKRCFFWSQEKWGPQLFITLIRVLNGNGLTSALCCFKRHHITPLIRINT